MSIRAAYCDLSDVKRLLSTQEKKVKFSSAYRRLEWNTNNNGTIRLTGFAISESYQGQERFVIAFSDSTNFTLTGDEIGYLGDGNLNQTFVSNDSNFTITSANWSGAALTDDEVSFETTSNLSDDNAKLFMRDAMYNTNGHLRKTHGDATNVTWYSDDSLDIPQEIELANIMLSACYIFQSIFVGANLEESPVSDWCDESEKVLSNYIVIIDDRKGLPHWRSRTAHVIETGITGVEAGVKDAEDIEDDISYKR